MCQVLQVSRSSYYEWFNTGPSKRDLESKKLGEQIKMIFNQSRKSYGTRRIQKALAKSGRFISRRRIKRLMKEQGLICKTRRKFKVTTDSKHCLPIAGNLLNRNFSPERANQVYAGILPISQHKRDGFIWLL